MALKLIYQLFANLLSWMVLQVAGQDAARQGAHREAAGHFAAATPHASRLAEPERGALFERYAAAAYLAGHIEAALAARGMALRVREGLGQRELVGENLRWISRLSWWTGRRIEAREAAGRAVAVLEVAPPSRELAMAYSNQSQLRAVAYEFEEAVTWGERARDLAQRLGDEETAITRR